MRLPGFSFCYQKVHVSCHGSGEGIWWKSWSWLFLSSWALFRVCSWMKRAALCCPCEQKHQGAASCLWRAEGHPPGCASAPPEASQGGIVGHKGCHIRHRTVREAKHPRNEMHQGWTWVSTPGRSLVTEIKANAEVENPWDFSICFQLFILKGLKNL